LDHGPLADGGSGDDSFTGFTAGTLRAGTGNDAIAFIAADFVGAPPASTLSASSTSTPPSVAKSTSPRKLLQNCPL
jgi:hypothetical protein